MFPSIYLHRRDKLHDVPSQASGSPGPTEESLSVLLARPPFHGSDVDLTLQLVSQAALDLLRKNQCILQGPGARRGNTCL